VHSKLSMLFIHDCSSVCETLVKQAVEAGDDATLVLPRGLSTYPDLADRTLVYSGGRTDAYETYAKALLREEYDVVVASSRLAWVMGALAKLERKSKLVSILMGSDIRRLETVQPAKRALFKMGLKASDYVYYASPDTYQQTKRLGVPFGHLSFPVDTEVFSPGGDSVSMPGSPSVFVPTRLDADKGSEAIVRLLRYVLKNYPGARLYVVRWARAQDRLAALLKSAERDRIDLLEFIPRRELPRYYRGASVLVGQMRYGFGSMIEMEAISCGLPAVFYDAFEGYGASEPGGEALSGLFDQFATDAAFRRRKVGEGIDLIHRTHDAREVYQAFRSQVAKVVE
jgi:glycosyltransferase involved in cell wall biosynthesis